MEFKITHSCLADLTVELMDPSGAKATLARGYGSGGDLYLGNCEDNDLVEGTWGTSFNPGTVSGPSCGPDFKPCVTTNGPLEDLDAFLGKEGTGQWELTIWDKAGGDAGNLDHWRVKLIC